MGMWTDGCTPIPWQSIKLPGMSLSLTLAQSHLSKSTCVCDAAAEDASPRKIVKYSEWDEHVILLPCTLSKKEYYYFYILYFYYYFIFYYYYYFIFFFFSRTWLNFLGFLGFTFLWNSIRDFSFIYHFHIYILYIYIHTVYNIYIMMYIILWHFSFEWYIENVNSID